MLDAGSAGVVGTADVEGMLDAGSSAGVAWAAGVEGKAETFNVQRSTFNVQRYSPAITTPPALPAPASSIPQSRNRHHNTTGTTSIEYPASSIQHRVSSIQYHSLANRRPNSTGPPSPHLLITYYALRFTILCNSR
jgi:hypothetical protein